MTNASFSAQPVVPDRAHAGWLLLVASLSLLPKAWLLWRYPAIPVSDFRSIVGFAQEIATHGPAAPGWFWALLSAGTSTVLAMPLALLPFAPDAIASGCTALMMGLVPLLPLLMLRGAVPPWVRLAMALTIAVQPAQWVFTSVVAQDNWVQLPAVALACLAIRSTRTGKAAPAAAALLWCLAAFVRQEMLVALLPLALVAACAPGPGLRRCVRPLAVFALVAAFALAAIVIQRGEATGRYALTTTHGGAAMLGSYVPGAGFGWKQYDVYATVVEPELAGDAEAIRARSGAIAWDEIRQRPAFHALRRLGALMAAATAAEGTLEYWALAAPEAQAPARRGAATRLAARVHPLVVAATLVLHALFVAALVVAWRRRDVAVLAIALAIAAKFGLHLVFASQARFFLVVSALEALAVGLALQGWWQDRSLRRPVAVVAAAALVAGTAITLALPRWQAWAEQVDASLPVKLALSAPGAGANCTLAGGTQRDADVGTIAFQVAHRDPSPGESAELRCRLRKTEAYAGLRLAVRDDYAAGGFDNRIIQEVWLDDRLVRRHDIADAAWSGWWSVPLGHSAQVRVRIVAVRPDAGPGWGDAALTEVRLVAAP